MRIKWYKIVNILLLIIFFDWSIELLSEPYKEKAVFILKCRWEKVAIETDIP